jgi:hypothetical protein
MRTNISTRTILRLENRKFPEVNGYLVNDICKGIKEQTCFTLKAFVLKLVKLTACSNS